MKHHERPFKCHICKKNFGSKFNLKSHLRCIHENYRPYKCNQCNSCFSDPSNFRRHLIFHSGVKQFTCHVCHKKFTR